MITYGPADHLPGTARLHGSGCLPIGRQLTASPAAVRAAIQAKGAQLFLLPPYSPDMNPIEMAFAKLKTLLRQTPERTRDGLWNRIGELLDRFTPDQCANYFHAAGYGNSY
jgi:transposase